MCRSSLDGNREIPRLASRGAPLWSASGRRGAVADDARTWEVRLRHSSWEADEQSRATGRGAGGAKGGGQGECEPAKHAPGAGPGKCVTGAGAHTASRKATEEGTVHLALPLSHTPSERFCSDRGRTSGHCTSRGAWDRGLALLETPVPASHYIHPEFGFFCPTPRFRRRLGVALACLVVAGVGLGVMATADRPQLAAAVTRANEASIAETTPATSLAPFAAVVPRLPVVAGAQTTADKPSCVDDPRTEGNCVSVKLRKPRMVWVANDRPAIAAVALGRSVAPTTGSIDAALLTARAGSLAARNRVQRRLTGF